MLAPRLAQNISRHAAKAGAIAPTAAPAKVNWLYFPWRLPAWLSGTPMFIQSAIGDCVRGSTQLSNIALYPPVDCARPATGARARLAALAVNSPRNPRRARPWRIMSPQDVQAQDLR